MNEFESPLKVVFVTHYTWMYGANRSLLCLIDGLGSSIRPLVLLPNDGGELYDELRRRNVEVLPCEIPVQFVSLHKRPSWLHPIQRRRWRATYTEEVSRKTAASVTAVMADVRLWAPDLIYSNSASTRMGSELAESLGLPHIWHLREFPENYGMCFIDGIQAFRRRLSRSRYMVAISKAVANRLVGTSCEDRLVKVFNGVGSSAGFEVLRERRASRGLNPRFRFLLIGQIWRSKGHDHAIQAAAYLSRQKGLAPFELRIVGDGDTDWVRGLVQKFETSAITQICDPTSDPFTEIINADCLLMCSPLEAMGRVTAEAMVAGCPVIGYAAGGTAELIDDMQTGLLYRGGYRILAMRMKQIMANQELRKRIVENAYTVGCERFSNEAYSAAILELMKNAKNSSILP